MKPLAALLISLSPLCPYANLVVRAQESRDANPLRRRVLTWCESTLADPNNTGYLTRLRGTVEQQMSSGAEMTILVDAGLSRLGTSHYALTWGGEFHVFDLTPAQASATGLVPGAVDYMSRDGTETTWRATPPMAMLGNLRLDAGLTATGDKVLAGSITYDIKSRPRTGRLALRTVYFCSDGFQPKTTDLADIPDQGTLAFKIGPVNDGKEAFHFGPTPLFVDLLFIHTNGLRFIAGNTASVLLNITPDFEDLTRIVIDLYNATADRLESIRDRATAGRARSDVLSLAVQQQYVLAEARRQKPPAEQEASVLGKWSDKLEAAAKRIENQVSRLKQADYAGPAYFEAVERILRARQP